MIKKITNLFCLVFLFGIGFSDLQSGRRRTAEEAGLINVEDRIQELKSSLGLLVLGRINCWIKGDFFYLNLSILNMCNTYGEKDHRIDDKKLEDIVEYLQLLGLDRRLTALNLGFNKIKNISSLRAFPNLTSLDLSRNQISDLRPLECLSRLTELRLSYNKIKYMSSVCYLTNLTELSLCGNQIEDISLSIQELKKLEKLNLAVNRISSIRQLHGLNLTHLYLYGNQIEDISFLGTITTLEDLRLGCVMKWLTYGNKISNFESIAHLPNLKCLDLSCNGSRDISVLRDVRMRLKYFCYLYKKKWSFYVDGIEEGEFEQEF